METNLVNALVLGGISFGVLLICFFFLFCTDKLIKSKAIHVVLNVICIPVGIIAAVFFIISLFGGLGTLICKLISIIFHWCVKHWIWVGIGILVVVILDAWFSEGVNTDPLPKKEKYHTETTYVVDSKEFPDRTSATLYAKQFHGDNWGAFINIKHTRVKDK